MTSEFRTRGSFVSRDWMVIPFDSLSIAEDTITISEIHSRTEAAVKTGDSINVESTWFGDRLRFEPWGDRYFLLASSAGDRLRWWLRAQGWTLEDGPYGDGYRAVLA